MTNLSKLSLDQLHQRLEELTVEWNEVEAQIEQRTKQDKQELAHLIQQKIANAGFDVDEIARLLSGRRGRTRTGSYTTWVDPDDAANTYMRGPLPAWLR